MRINIIDGKDMIPKEFGKHIIPGGQYLGISNGAIGFLDCLEYLIIDAPKALYS